MLKNFEIFLRDQKYEDLLQFLINELIKSDFFYNDNFKNYLRIKKNIKINSSLINNIESENIQEHKIGFNDLKKKESSRSIENQNNGSSL